MSSIVDSVPIGAVPARRRSRWNKELEHYPSTGRRTLYLAITVVATITTYFQLYIAAGVGPKIISGYGFTFTQFVLVAIILNLVGAFAALAGGLADRWGRSNLVAGGLLAGGLLVLFAVPNAPNKVMYTVFFCLVAVVEGINLVATPALIRDFSPQVGRGLAMGFWTLGPALGSLVVAEVASHTVASHPDWQFQFRIAGATAVVVAVVAFVGLRELSPRLRDQLMVTMHDRALVEARAAGMDLEKEGRGHWRLLLRFHIVGSALSIGVFLASYFVLTGFMVVYLSTVFGWSSTRANNLANWYYLAFAVFVVVGGVLSDRLLVRKPVMVGGAVVSLIGGGLFAAAATSPNTGYHTLQLYLILMAAGTASTFVAWMAGFTETVEKHSPAATATGLAIWGWSLRIVVVAMFSLFVLAVPATTTLFTEGAQVGAIVAKYPQLTGGQATSAAPVPAADLAYVKANVAKVTNAVKDNPKQWQRWWWVCFLAQLLFIPCVFLLTGRWNPRKAREDIVEHERRVDQELALSRS